MSARRSGARLLRNHDVAVDGAAVGVALVPVVAGLVEQAIDLAVAAARYRTAAGSAARLSVRREVATIVAVLEARLDLTVAAERAQAMAAGQAAAVAPV